MNAMFCPRDRILYKSYRCMLLSSPGPTVAETPPVLHLVSVQNTELQPFEQSDPENWKRCFKDVNQTWERELSYIFSHSFAKCTHLTIILAVIHLIYMR